ncbi:hypothetical protein M378DRAFT_199309 [Amanita muscaria Koide BX008]|uniref:Mug135-like C-terminal domain-containing protein n=1 Tax=Amanita muscaria (strain Koide BX008) TaxID=946122 RepID=A0A0C2X095_AMAMK|nr:hypothetical protein M378DRAFT_199309 [Amanita muscaria Koide BX008]
MAIPLPQLSYLPVSKMPQAPGNIPTLKDIANADILEHNVRESHANATNTYEDLAKAIIYKTKLVSASAGGHGAPVWFGAAMADALEPIRNEMRAMRATMDGEFQTVKANIEALKEESAKTRRLTAQYNLPPLTSVEAIHGITDRQLDLYLRNYHPHLRRVIRDRNERIDLIASAIGMRDIDLLH